MKSTNEIGKKGELIAQHYLESKRYTIIATNFRHQKAEIDIIAKKENVLTFIEVKYRTSITHGLPEEAIDEKKKKLIMSAAEHYIMTTNWEGAIQFDVISIIEDGSFNILHLEDVFY